MYKVYCDNHLIYENNVPGLRLSTAKLDLELNKTGSFVFTMYPNHIHYTDLYEMQSIITVYQKDELIFRGRILNIEKGFYNSKQVTCEGELAFLLDSIIRPFDFSTGETRKTPSELFAYFIEQHNSMVDSYKQFVIGNVTVVDGDTTNDDNLISRSSTEHKNTWDMIQESLVEKLGGYLYVRYEGEIRYIDYLKDFDVLSNQPITFGKNLLDITKGIKGENLATAIIPVGKNEDDSDLLLNFGETPVELQDGIYGYKDYIYNQSMVKKHGFIFATNKWDDVGTTDALQNKAISELINSYNFLTSIEVKAVDLSAINQNFHAFNLGRKVIVQSKHHLSSDELEKYYLVNKLSVDLLNPQSNVLTLTSEYSTSSSLKSFTEQNLNSATSTNLLIKELGESQTQQTVDVEDALARVTEQVQSSISQTAEEIKTTVAEEHYYKGEIDTLIGSVNTQFIQTNEEFEFRFNEFMQSLEDVANNTDAHFLEIFKYIRFVDGKILLGEVGNQLTLTIQNDRISFLESGVEVAYISNRKLYILQAEFIKSLTIGKFAYVPRDNGNLSFKKVE